MRLILDLRVRNIDATKMPAGLGVHPFFPDNNDAFLKAVFGGCWTTDEYGFPSTFDRFDSQKQYFGGQPLGECALDHVFLGSEDLTVTWRDKPRGVRLCSSENIVSPFAYVPGRQDFFVSSLLATFLMRLTWMSQAAI